MIKLFRYATACAAFASLLTGCGTAVSTGWQNVARQCMDTAFSAGAERFVPAEAENIRETMQRADANLKRGNPDEADRLYRLSNQKCQLMSAKLFPHTTVVRIHKGEGGQLALLSDERDEVLSRSELDAVQPDDAEAAVVTTLAVKVLADTDTADNLRDSKRNATRKRPKRTSAGQLFPAARRLNPAATTLYLTFDDGPSYLTVPIANYLKSEGILATFFVLGRNVKGREKAVTATIALGHQVANHTYSHNLKALRTSLNAESSEVRRTAGIIERLGGDGKMVRIPYGASDAAIRPKVVAEGAQIYDWDINSNDSTMKGVRNPQLIEKSVLNRLGRSGKRHLVLLFHDGAGHDSTLTALKELIPRLKQEGYRFGLLTRSEKVARSTVDRQVAQ